MVTFLIVCMLIGAIAGFLSGLLGIGGGILFVPGLALALPYFGIAEQDVMHIAIASSLACIVFTSGMSAFSHYQLSNVVNRIVLKMAPGLVVGALCGALIADYFSSYSLQIIFAIFLLVVAWRFWQNKRTSSLFYLPIMITTVSAFIISTLSALLGIGGGSLTVPFLLQRGVPMKPAIGTSSVCTVMIALSGVLGFVMTGMNKAHLLNYHWGYIYFPAVIALTTTSLISAYYGARFTQKLSTDVLRKIFALFILLVALKLLIG